MGTLATFFKSFLPAGFSNVWSGGLNPRVRKEGASWFYLFQGQNVDLPFRTGFEIMRGIPHVGAVINKIADMFSTVRFKVVRTDTEEEEVDTKHTLNNVLANPNKMQTWKQMLYMNSIYKSVAGVSFIYPGFGLSQSASRLAYLITIDFDAYVKDINQTYTLTANEDLDNIVRRIIFTFRYGNHLTYKPSELIQFKDNAASYVEDYTRLTGLAKNIENIYKALVGRGVLIDSKGGIGMISGNQKDSGMSVPMSKNERKRLTVNLNKYGLGESKEPIILTDVPLRYTPMVFPTRELMLFEEIEDDFHTICDTYGVNRELFENDTTFTNKEMAERNTYQNTIVPAWFDFFELLNKGLHVEEEKRKIIPDFSHVECLQQNESDKINTEFKKSEMLLKEFDRQIITLEEYRQQMGYEK